MSTALPFRTVIDSIEESSNATLIADLAPWDPIKSSHVNGPQWTAIEKRSARYRWISSPSRSRPHGLDELGVHKDKLEVGEVNLAHLNDVLDILKALTIETVEPEPWNCQDWTLDGLTHLREIGIVYDYMSNEAVKSWSKEA